MSSYKNRYHYKRYITSYLMVFDSYYFIEENKVYSKDIEERVIESEVINKNKTIVHSIITTLKSIVESLTKFIVPVSCFYVYLFTLTYASEWDGFGFTTTIKGTRFTKHFTFKNFSKVNDVWKGLYDFGLYVQNLLKDTPLGKIDTMNDTELFLYTIIGIVFLFVVADIILKKIPYIIKENRSYKRYQILHHNHLEENKYKRIDPSHNQFVLFTVFLIVYIGFMWFMNQA